MKKISFWLLAALAGHTAYAAPAPVPAPTPAPGFGLEENKAQWPAVARYRALVPGGAVWLRDAGFTYDWVSATDLKRHAAAQQAAQQAQAAARPGAAGPARPAEQAERPAPTLLHGHAVAVDFVGAAPTRPRPSTEPLASYTNYFVGTDSSKWASRVRSYAAVTYPQLYPGVDVRVHGSASGQFEYDVVLAPGASLAPVRLRYRGATSLRLRPDGALAIGTSVGEVREQRPVAWQLDANGQRTGGRWRARSD